MRDRHQPSDHSHNQHSTFNILPFSIPLFTLPPSLFTLQRAPDRAQHIPQLVSLAHQIGSHTLSTLLGRQVLLAVTAGDDAHSLRPKSRLNGLPGLPLPPPAPRAGAPPRPPPAG